MRDQPSLMLICVAGGMIDAAASLRRDARGSCRLLGFYSAARALPFPFSRVAVNVAKPAFAFFKRHCAAIRIGLGMVLVAMGYFVWADQLFQLKLEAQRFVGALGRNSFITR